MQPVTHFLVGRTDLRACHFEEEAQPPEVKPGEVLLKVDRFAFTANNVTYGAFGDAMSYWSFFPAPAPAFGRIPVWGFADVAASLAPGIAEGERIYGYLPMSTAFKVQAANIKPGYFYDGAAHRQDLSPFYNQYLRCAADPAYDPAQEDYQMLFKPLFTTAFLIEDMLREKEWFGAEQIIISSASAKTSIGLAFLLKQKSGAAIKTAGLTSAANRTFVEGLGCYDEVIVYEELASLGGAAKAVLVDIAGNGEVRRRVHERLGDRLALSLLVGGAHWDKGQPGAGGSLPGPEPEFFFAPTEIGKRIEAWGAGGFQSRLAEAWNGFAAFAAGWMTVTSGSGRAAIEQVYRHMLAGTARPEEGHILSFE